MSNADGMRATGGDDEERLRAMVEGIQDALLAIDRSWRVTYANGVALRASGMAKEQLVGRSLWDAFPMLVGTELARAYERAMAGEPTRIEARGAFSARWFDVVVTPVADGVVVCARDVTAMHEATASARASEERLRRLADALPVLISYIDAEQRYRFNNRAYETWFGRRAEDLQGRTMREVLGASAHERLQPAIRRVMAGESFSFEAEVVYATGGTRHIGATYVPDRDAEGVVRGYYALVLDVTARKQVELALRESEARFRRVADDAPVMIWVTEPDGSCSYLSRRWLEFTGQDAATALGFGWVEALHVEDQERAHRAFVDANAARAPFRLEYRLRRVDGEYRRVLDSASPRFAADGAFLGYIGSVVDITELREAERLQARLLEREREARTAAEAATRLKDEFLATLSHELRTPLNAILGWTGILRTDLRDPAKAVRAVDVIERNGRAQAQLIDDMLDMSRILAGKLRIDVQQVDLGAVVHAAVDAVRPAADAKGVALHVAAAWRAPTVIAGDFDRLQQVLWNLLSNAVKFTPRGGRVDVAMERDARHVRVLVADSGEGISPEFVPRLFGRFNQADGSTTRPHGGLGIGLALVKELVELHGGTVRVASAGVGAGATFTIELPLRVGAAGDAGGAGPLAAGASPVAEGPLVDLTGLRVLLVEDDEDSLAMVAHTLGQAGASVTTARSGAEALALLAQQGFDVLLSDIGMSPMDGYALLGEVRRRGITTPALALTAFARPVDRARAHVSGFRLHLAKPVSAAAVTAAVAAAARGDGAPRS